MSTPTNRHATSKTLHDVSQQQWDSIVIGSGMGGLTAASLLCQVGERVLLLEKHTKLGGCTHVFTRPAADNNNNKQDEIEFDTGVHYVGGHIWQRNSFPRQTFDFITNNKTSWKRLDDVYDVAVVDGRKFSFPSGFQQQIDYLKQEFPTNTDSLAIDRYFADVKRTADKGINYFRNRTAEAYVNRFLVQLFEDTTWGKETVDEALNRLGVTNITLRNALTYLHGDYGAMPHEASWAQHALTVLHYVDGAAYPVGGSLTIAEAVAELLESTQTSRALTHAGVAELVLNDSNEVIGVKMEHNGIIIKSKKVISCTGAGVTFNKLFPQECTVPAVVMARKDLATMPLSPSHVMVFIVLNGSSDELHLPSQNWWINCTQQQQDLAHDEFESVFISFPSAKDPTTWNTSHPNLSVCELVVASKYAIWDVESWSTQPTKHRDGKYVDAKDKCAKLAMEVLMKYFPQLRDKVKYMEASTPLSFAHYLNSLEGCAYGIRAVPRRYELNRTWLSPQSNVKNLYLGGQDVSSCGVVGAMCGGMMAAAAANLSAMMKVGQLSAGYGNSGRM